MPKKIAILYSGGLDSLIMKRYAEVTEPEAGLKFLYYLHGSEAEEQEVLTLPDFVDVRKVDWLNDQIRPVAKLHEPQYGAIFVPGRNLVFAVLAACQELANEVWLGVVAEEDRPGGTDKNSMFKSITSSTLSYVLSPFVDNVRIRFPLVENKWTKLEAIAWALNNGITEQDMVQSVSCYYHDGLPCGECMSCFKRYLNFGLNGFEEEYRVHPINSDAGRQKLKHYLTNEPKNEDDENLRQLIQQAKHFFPSEMIDYIEELNGSFRDTNSTTEEERR